MGKTLLELFESAKNGELNVLPGVPLEVKGDTPKERYDIKNSKDIRVSSSSPLLKLSFGALNAIRRGIGERKSESFLEEELSGARVLRTLSLPIIYGTDIIRLTTESTSVVEKMKNSANGGEGSPFSKFGQKIQATRDKITNSKLLGLPKPLNPTEYYTQFNKPLNPVYDRMIAINDIKENAAGTQFGKILKNSAGDTAGVVKQVLGNSLASAKKALRKKILGVKGQSENGNNDFSRLDNEGESRILYSQYEDERYSTGKASKISDDSNLKYNIKDIWKTKKGLNPTYPNITLTGDFKGSKNYYTRVFENFDIGANGNSDAPDDGSFLFYNINNKFDIKDKYTNYPDLRGSGTYNKASKIFDLNRSYLDTKDYRFLTKDNIEEFQVYKQSLYSTYENWKDYYFFPLRIFNFTETENPVESKDLKRIVNSDFNNPFSNNFKFNPQNSEGYTTPPNSLGKDEVVIGNDTSTGKNKVIKVDELRPPYLRKNYSKQKKYSKTPSENSKTLYGDISDNLESRGLGVRKDLINQTGRLTNSELSTILYNGKTLDKIDLVPVKFTRINDGVSVYMRSSLTSFQESFTPNWEGKQMLGTPYKFYTYSSIERKVSFNLKAYSLSHLELIMMWEKLSFIAQMTYPFNITNTGTTPTLINFTLGNLYINKPAIVTSLTYNIEDNENIWEIGGTDAKIRFGNYTNEFDDKFSVSSQGAGVKVDKQIDTSNVLSTNVFTKLPSYQTKYNSQTDTGKEIFKKNDVRKEDILTQNLKINDNNVSMDNYKVPKVISIQLELTFLETNNSHYNIYSVGRSYAYKETQAAEVVPSQNLTSENKQEQEYKAALVEAANTDLATAARRLAREENLLEGEQRMSKVEEVKIIKAAQAQVAAGYANMQK